MAYTKIPGNLIETGAITGDVLADGGIATAKLADAAVTTDKILDANITHAKLHTSMDLTGKTVTVATAAGSTNTTAAASTAFVQQELTTLIGGAPGTLDTLNELAAAINDDANYNSTLTTALATKLPLAGGTMTGALTSNSLIKTTGHLEIASTQPRILLDRNDGSYSWNIYNGNGSGNFPTSTFNIANNAGTAVITALDSGNVGIGTTSPQQLLDIKGTAPNIRFTDDRQITWSGTEKLGGVEWFTSDTSANGVLTGASIYCQNSVGSTLPNFNMVFATQVHNNSSAPIERMRVTSDGDVLIGSDTNLNVLSGTPKIQVGDGTGHSSIQWYSGTSNVAGLYFGDATTGAERYTGYIEYRHSDDSMAFRVNGDTRLFIESTGNVGIGTTSFNSGARLEVNDLGSVGKILLTRSGSPRAEFSTNANEGELSLYRSNNAKQVYFSSYYDSYITGGNLGIGTASPNLPLTVTSNSGANAIAIRARSGDDYGFLQFYNNAGDTVRGQVYSHSTGNAVGISTGNSSSNGIKIDTEGLHFQKADGQKISAKESIVMEVDTDNNTASRVFQVIHGNGKTLLNLHDDYRTEVGTLQYNSTRSAGAGATSSFSASAGDWVDVAAIPYGRNVATIKFFWDGLSAPGSAHHGLMEFDIASHYGTSYYYGWDSSINLKNSTAHNSFYISEARIITPNGSGATGYFQVKFAVAVSTGTFRSYVTARDEQCSIDPVNPAVNNSRSGSTIAHLKLGTDQGLVRNRVNMATSRDMHIGGGLTIVGQTSFNAYSPPVTSTNNTVIFGSTRHNIGSGYSTSTGRFTASTSGKYFFTFDVLMDSSANANYGRLLFRVNNVGGTMEQYGDSLTYQATGQSYFGLGLTCIISLNVGDYVEVYNAGQWSTYGTQYGVFCGHLLG